MTNEQIAKHLSSGAMFGGFTLAENNAAYQAAMAMAEWKDEQCAEEKQQWIDKVCEWIKEHNGDYISIVPNDHLTNNFYDDLRKEMKGEY